MCSSGSSGSSGRSGEHPDTGRHHLVHNDHARHHFVAFSVFRACCATCAGSFCSSAPLQGSDWLSGFFHHVNSCKYSPSFIAAGSAPRGLCRLPLLQSSRCVPDCGGDRSWSHGPPVTDYNLKTSGDLNAGGAGDGYLLVVNTFDLLKSPTGWWSGYLIISN